MPQGDFLPTVKPGFANSVRFLVQIKPSKHCHVCTPALPSTYISAFPPLGLQRWTGWIHVNNRRRIVCEQHLAGIRRRDRIAVRFHRDGDHWRHISRKLRNVSVPRDSMTFTVMVVILTLTDGITRLVASTTIAILLKLLRGTEQRSR